MPVPFATALLWAQRGYAAWQVAEAIRQQFCRIQNQFPEFTDRVIGAIPGGGLLNPLVPAICPNAPPTSQQLDSPYSGGQCCGSYTVFYRIVANGQTVDRTIAVNGKLGGLSNNFFDVPDSQGNMGNQWQGSAVLQTGLDCPGVNPTPVTLHNAGNNLGARPIVTITRVTRAGGAADNCGDRPILFNPRQPTAGDLNFNVTIPVGGRNINIPVRMNLTLNPTVNFNFSPTISFNTPYGDIYYSPDGIDIFFPGSGTDPNQPYGFPDPRPPTDRPPPALPPSTRPRQPTAPPTGGGDCPDVDLKPVLDAVAEVQDVVDETLELVKELSECDRCEFLPEECTKTLIGTGQGGKFQLSPDALWVEVSVIQKPSNWKGYSVPNSPDVVFAGWHSFGSSICEGVRTPIQYDKNIYPKASQSSAFSYGLQTGYSANCYAYLRPSE